MQWHNNFGCSEICFDFDIVMVVILIDWQGLQYAQTRKYKGQNAGKWDNLKKIITRHE